MLSQHDEREILRSAMRYAKGTVGSWFSRLGQKFGAFGEVVGMVVDILSGGGKREPSRRDVSDAIELLGHHGFRVSPGPAAPGDVIPPPIITPSGIQRPQRPQPPAISTRTRGNVPVPPAQPVLVTPADIWPEERIISTLPTRIRGAYDLVPADVEGLSPEIETPESSNVFSLQYDFDNSLLYIRYKADSAPIGYKEIVSSCSGEKYKCAIRPHVPGPLYSYGGAKRGITPEQFAEFVGAASHGKWIWNNLRVCGSQHEHQVPYTLTSVPAGGYIPRRATARGFRVRNVPTVGFGRRGSRQSTLPERIR